MTGGRGPIGNPVIQAASDLLDRLDRYDRKIRLVGEALRHLTDTRRVIEDLIAEVKRLRTLLKYERHQSSQQCSSSGTCPSCGRCL